jgi:MOSC domain-containing protein YiiM
MKVLSVNVGRPRDTEWRTEMVQTAIYKAPVSGPVAVTGLNIAGDQQADLSVHGGPAKAVYAYPSEHYAFWREEGHLGAGDPLDLVPTDEHAISVAEVQPGVTTFTPGFGRLIRERVRRGGTR